MQEQEYFCPSFSSYSTNRVAEIAVKVSDEINVDGAGSEEDFEFSFDRQIQPDLLLNDVSYDVDRKGDVNGDSSVQVSLKDLFLEDREMMSSSSSEVDELESVPPGTYCVWKPKVPEPSRCKKSNSTGSAFKRWSIRDLMRRSNSEGKDSFVFLTPEKGMKNETSKAKESSEAKDKASSSRPVYLRNQAAPKEKDKNKRKSYLPYRQHLLGIFANDNSLGRTFPPF
ncbi:hypothetical protein RND71_032642 [Anisodus tanguticus]|uniref:Uncharacterized protein n=1 Tax=Anisodus tanguticus TaxID=243964 RepID=A0AAE1R775_9SOLA|nr:hypothetical protein RND71_032642 [Anisodus tanguticus]